MAQKPLSKDDAPQPATEAHLLFTRVGEHALPLPSRATPGSAGIDLSAAEAVIVRAGPAVTPVKLGFAVAIPAGHAGLLTVRSGLGKRGVGLANGVGVIDSDYRGELVALLTKHTAKDLAVEVGDRIAQLVIVPVLTLPIVEATSLVETKRGSGGFGSTGR